MSHVAFHVSLAQLRNLIFSMSKSSTQINLHSNQLTHLDENCLCLTVPRRPCIMALTHSPLLTVTVTHSLTHDSLSLSLSHMTQSPDILDYNGLRQTQSHEFIADRNLDFHTA